MKPPIFACGSGRCGTTILGRSMGRHSKIVGLADEPRVFGEFLTTPDKQGGLGDIRYHTEDSELLAHIYSRLSVDLFRRHNRRLGRDVGICSDVEESTYRLALEELFGVLGSKNGQDIDLAIRRFLSRIFESTILRKEGAHRWCDDSPPHIFYIPQIVASFPEAKVLHVIRDGREVAHSFLRLGWERTFQSALCTWYSRVSIGRRLGSTFRGNYMEISFASLVEAPETTMAEVLDFVEEPWEDTVVELLDEERARKHVKQFSDEENSLFKRLAPDLIEEFGWTVR